MQEKINVNELVEIKQLPIIFYQLEVLGKQIDKELAKVKKMECTEENKQEVKKIRTGINKLKDEFEEKRKEIKNSVLDTYNQFNEKYETEVKGKLEKASLELSDKIKLIEDTQIEEKFNELLEFVENNIDKYNLRDIIDGRTAIKVSNVRVNISSTLKSLKDGVNAVLERINNEVQLIKLEDGADEIMVEYVKNFDLVKAKTIVLQRKKELEEMKRTLSDKVEQDKIDEIQTQKVEDIIAPVEIVEEEDLIEVSFKVKGTKTQLKELKEFLKKVGIIYE